ncbi:mannose-1-phosphate guanylyltransferase, partial [Patescibacteria group bacterium]|nr:mannose-1-phosphate guanylyltransferase [Patescibacteria group bacterium]
KQLFDLISNQSMLKDTIDRFKIKIPVENIFINPNKNFIPEIKKQLPKFPPENIIAEPVPRNTASAIGLCCTYIYKKDPKAIAAFFPADHRISHEKKFVNYIVKSGKLAKKLQRIVLLGIKPTFPHTGLGYINIDKPIKNPYVEAYKIKKFIEKPKLSTAKKFFKSRKHLWNAGMYIAPVKVMLDAFKKHLPKSHLALQKIYDAIGTKQEQTVLKKYFPKMDNIPIDYGISEKEKNLIGIPADDIGWSDIGTWKTLFDELCLNNHEKVCNVIKGEVYPIDTDQSLIYGLSKPIATVGLRDTIIVDMPDITLVCHKDKTNEVRKVIELLKQKKKDKYL